MTIGAVLLVLLRWGFVLSWRFFTGAHLNGKKYNDSTWLQDASLRYRKMPRYYTWWRRKSRAKRAGWRNGIFWPTLGIFIGFLLSWQSMILVLGFAAPGTYLMVRDRIRFVFFIPLVVHGADGSVTQQFSLKPKYRRLLTKLRRPEGVRIRPGVALPGELKEGIEQPPEEIKLLAEKSER